LLLLLGVYALVGVLLALSGETTLLLVGVRPESVWFEAATYPLIAVAVAFVGSLAVRTRLDQEELETALQSNVAMAARIRSEYERERASLARLLHAGVQSELIAGALSLTASASPNDAGARTAEIVGRARDALRGESDEPDAAEQVGTLLDSWSSAIGLTARIGDGVWERLGEPSRTSAVVDAISEGLANAVRHGDGSPVALELRPAARGGVEVVVRSGGVLAASGSGIGLKQLSERGTVALRERAGRVELAVAIP
jgi:signal transduction histidine kinase